MHETILQAIARHQLPADFVDTIRMAYLPVVAEIAARSKARQPALLMGLQGCQGSGKSTMAEFLQLLLAAEHELKAVVLSIDDFYLTLSERQQLAAEVHPLLLTRGVPGTHDVSMAVVTLKQLQALKTGESCSLVSFNKAIDDRANQQDWPQVQGPIDVIILEGWCIAMPPQAATDLTTPMNELEKNEDADGCWRQYVNQQLQDGYADLFAMLDFLAVLEAPSFECVYGWRKLQEQKLAERLKNAPAEKKAKLLGPSELARFIAHYQRLTEHGLKHLAEQANFVITLDSDHVVDRVVSHAKKRQV